MTPLAVFPIWADPLELLACRILMYQDRCTIEFSAYGGRFASTEVSSIEHALDLADECCPEHLRMQES